jgi:betaine-aldehyde dehydrogenase
VVLKPSEVAPLSAFILAEIIAEVGLPAGVFNLVSGYGPVVGGVARHPDIDMVSFTGSTRRQTSLELAAGTVKRWRWMGGKSAAHPRRRRSGRGGQGVLTPAT